MRYYIHDLIPDPFNRRVLLSIISVISVYGLSIGYIYPLISLKLEAREYTPLVIGIMGMVPFIASIIASPLIPLIIRAINVGRLVLIAICTDLVMIAMLTAFDDINVWFVCRFIMGVAGTVLFVVSETWINEIAEDRTRGRILGLYTFTFSATLGLSPLFIVFLGVDGKLPFVVAFAVIALALIPLRWTRGSEPDFSGGRVSHVLKFIVLAPTLVGAVALMSFEEAAIVTLLPVYSIKNGVSTDWAAMFLTVIAVGSMAAQPLIGSLADRINRYYLIFACAGVMLVSILSLPLVIKSPVVVWPVLLIWGGATAGIYTVALAIMGQRFRGAQLAAGNAAFGVMWGVSGGISPALGGAAMTAWDENGLIVTMAVATVAFLILAFVRRIAASR
ncbi:MAG: MFS transporter [Acidiferrobacterales bacterium]|nr:MFS transporter [Acidiferrobacterales bacterium]